MTTPVSALNTFNLPPLTTLPLKDDNGSTLSMSLAFNWAVVKVGSLAKSSAAAPLT